VIVIEDLGNCGSYDSVAPADTATGFTAAKIKPVSGTYLGMTAKAALIIVEDNAVNFTLDGTTPTAKAGTNVGLKLDADQSYVIVGADNVLKFKCIDRVSGSTGTVKALIFF
jgi:hypothetical protein